MADDRESTGERPSNTGEAPAADISVGANRSASHEPGASQREKAAQKQLQNTADGPTAHDPDSKDQPSLLNTDSISDSETDSDPFDFGGLPNRNLKKNLGCGG